MAVNQVPPVHTLPRDVLTEIFCLVHSGVISFGDPDIPAWQISLVCTSWHEIAFNIPQLWTNIRLESKRLPKGEEAFDVMVTSWKSLLKRSRGCSLNLFLHDGPHLPLLLAECFEHADRWYHIDFAFPLELLTFTSNSDIVFPRLRSIRLTDPRHPAVLRGVRELTVFKNAPLLSDISFSNLAISVQNLKLPWSQITHCRIKRPVEDWNSSEEVALLPKLMPNIVSLGIFGYSGGSDHVGLAGKAVLPDLRKLTLDTKGAPLFLNSVRAPCLNDLEILGPADSALWCPPVSEFLLQSGCHITSITFGPSMSFESSFFACLPHLDSLSLLPLPSNKELFRDLTIKNSQSQYLCPQLRKLTLSGAYVAAAWHKDLVAMLESRLHFSDNSLGDYPRKLESLHVISWPFAEGEGSLRPPGSRQDWERVRKLKAGLPPRYKIRVTYGGKYLNSFWHLSHYFWKISTSTPTRM